MRYRGFLDQNRHNPYYCLTSLFRQMLLSWAQNVDAHISVLFALKLDNHSDLRNNLQPSIVTAQTGTVTVAFNEQSRKYWSIWHSCWKYYAVLQIISAHNCSKPTHKPLHRLQPRK